MNPLVIGVACFIFLLLASFVAGISVYYTNVACPNFGSSCAAATPTPTPYVSTLAATTAPAYGSYTELLGAQQSLTTVKQAVLPLPTFGASPYAYTLSFWINIPATANNWRSVLRFGPDDSHRAPAIFVVPNGTGLHYRQDTTAKSNEGFDNISGISLTTWTHFAMTVSGRVMTPYINGAAVTPMTLGGDPLAATDQVYIAQDPAAYVSAATPVSLAAVWFFPRALAASDVQNVYGTPKVLT